MQELLNDLGEIIQEGYVFENNQVFDKLLKNSPVKFLSLSSQEFSENLKIAEQHYKGKQRKALQCVWSLNDEDFQQETNKSQEILSKNI